MIQLKGSGSGSFRKYVFSFTWNANSGGATLTVNHGLNATDILELNLYTEDNRLSNDYSYAGYGRGNIEMGFGWTIIDSNTIRIDRYCPLNNVTTEIYGEVVAL